MTHTSWFSCSVDDPKFFVAYFQYHLLKMHSTSVTENQFHSIYFCSTFHFTNGCSFNKWHANLDKAKKFGTRDNDCLYLEFDTINIFFWICPEKENQHATFVNELYFDRCKRNIANVFMIIFLKIAHAY